MRRPIAMRMRFQFLIRNPKGRPSDHPYAPGDDRPHHEAAECLKGLAQACKKPVLSCWMGGSSVSAGRAVLTGSDVATFEYPEGGCAGFRLHVAVQRQLACAL